MVRRTPGNRRGLFERGRLRGRTPSSGAACGGSRPSRHSKPWRACQGYLLTTNRGIAAWGEIFDDTTVAAAILDRLLHHGIVLTINGPSYRMRRHQERLETLRDGLQAAPVAD